MSLLAPRQKDYSHLSMVHVFALLVQHAVLALDLFQSELHPFVHHFQLLCQLRAERPWGQRLPLLSPARRLALHTRRCTCLCISVGDRQLLGQSADPLHEHQPGCRMLALPLPV